MQIKYSIRKEKRNSKGLCPIQIIISFSNQRIRKNIKGVKCLEKHWKNERIKPNLKSEDYNHHIEYNKRLDEHENRVKLIKRYVLLNNIEPTKKYILDKLEDPKHIENSITPDFINSFEEFISTSKNTKAKGTIKKYRSTINFIKDFQEHTNFDLNFENISMNFYENFSDYAFEERNTLNNYFGRLISVIKTFMNWSFERGYHENLDFKKFKAISNDTEVIYLTIDELLMLYNYKFDSKRLEHVRDFYCLGCFTGLRFSDLKQLKPSNVFDHFLLLNIQKTKSIDHKIPLNDFSKEILNKYKKTLYAPIPQISGQKFNQYIKECCQIVGINKKVNITRYIGQRRVDKEVPKYQLITSHTARKSFVTNSLVLGMKEMIVRNITGHKDEKSFKRYVDISEDFKQKEMDNTWNKLQ